MIAVQEEKISRVIHRLEEEDTEDRRIRTEQGKDPNREPMLTLHPHSARLCHIMVQSICAKRLVEIGSSHGYSSVWLAHAARITGGQFTSLEVNPKLVEIAKQNVAEAGLTDNVTFIAGDARETMSSVEGPLDFVLLDCWEPLYVELLDLIASKLHPGGLLVADNVIPGREGSDEYIQALTDHPLMETVSVPIGKEIEVSVRRLE